MLGGSNLSAFSMDEDMISNRCKVNEHRSHRNILKGIKHVWTLTKQAEQCFLFRIELQCDIGHEKLMRAIRDGIQNI